MVRHGEIPSNINKVYAGRSSENLTDNGIHQAKEVAVKLSGFNIDVIFTSPIQRAVQTADIIRAKLNIELRIETAFRELEMGPWEGMSEIDVAREYPEEWNIWNSRPAELRLPERETLDELLERVLKGVRAVYSDIAESNVVIVTHVAIIRVLLLWHANKGLNLYKEIHVPNAKFFEISLDAMPGL